jgi:hypothetical protein
MPSCKKNKGKKKRIIISQVYNLFVYKNLFFGRGKHQDHYPMKINVINVMTDIDFLHNPEHAAVTSDYPLPLVQSQASLQNNLV